MEFELLKFIEKIVLPPNLFLLLIVIGLGVSPIWRRKGLVIAASATVLLIVFSMPWLASGLINSLQSYPAIPPNKVAGLQHRADVIVVLAAGRRRQAPEFGDDTLSKLTLERVRYAAYLARVSKLPIVISGGKPQKADKNSEAYLIQQALINEFQLPVKQIEEYSRNTYENAYYSNVYLSRLDLKRVVLVTHAWHMPRAVEAFKHFELQVVPAPTAFEYSGPGVEFDDIIPSTVAMRQTYLAFHEMLGRKWYQLRYY